jgi:uncharacterized lipoprotein
MIRGTLLVLLLAGCSSPRREAEAERRGYERGRAHAVKEMYWAIQARERDGGNRR